MSLNDPVFLAGGIWKPPLGDEPARPAPEPGEGALAAGSPLALRIRGGAQYHPAAEEHYLALCDAFQERLEAEIASAITRENVETASTRHVIDAYDAIVVKTRKRQTAEYAASALGGAALSGIVSVLIDLAEASTAPSDLQIALLVGFFLSALAAAYVLGLGSRR